MRMLTLTEMCQYLKNWEFDREPDKYIGKITVANGEITLGGVAVPLVIGQYFRVIGSLFSDGIHQFPDDAMPDETFDGAIWSMAIPPAVIDLADEIDAWRGKFESIDSPAMSPYNSESFSGYSYSKSGAGSSAVSTASGLTGWQAAFASRLNHWRKI